MTSTESQPTCVLPGCTNTVAEQGRPCQDCVAAFGDYLRIGEGPGLTAQQQAARDSETMHMYALQLKHDHQQIGAKTALPDVDEVPPAPPSKEEPERKANQRCWMCEERHTCTKEPHGWECDNCRSIT